MGGGNQSKVNAKSRGGFEKVNTLIDIKEDSTENGDDNKAIDRRNEVKNLEQGMAMAMVRATNPSKPIIRVKSYIDGEVENFIFKINENHIFENAESMKNYVPYVEKEKIFEEENKVDYNLLFEKKSENDGEIPLLRHMIHFIHSCQKNIGSLLWENHFKYVKF